MARHNVSLEHMILKTSMVVSGKDCARQAGVDEVAERTLRVLKRTVPAALPGIVFLSGGQSDETATAHLDAMNRHGRALAADLLLRRALQNPALKAWRGPGGERRRRAEGLPPPRAHERPRRAGQVEAPSCEKQRRLSAWSSNPSHQEPALARRGKVRDIYAVGDDKC